MFSTNLPLTVSLSALTFNLSLWPWLQATQELLQVISLETKADISRLVLIDDCPVDGLFRRQSAALLWQVGQGSNGKIITAACRSVLCELLQPSFQHFLGLGAASYFAHPLNMKNTTQQSKKSYL